MPPVHYPAIDHDATAGARTDDDAKGHRGALRGAVRRLRQDEAIGIVAQANGMAQGLLEVLPEGPTIQPNGVGVFHEPRGCRNRSRDADTNGRAFGRLPLDSADEIDHTGEGRGIVAAWRGNALPDNDYPTLHGDPLNFGAAEIDADAHGTQAPPPQRL